MSASAAARVSVLVLLAALCTNGALAAVQQGASVSLKARWSGTSYLLEAAEFLADEDPQLLWKFIGSQVISPSSGDDDAACWRSILGAVQPLTSPTVSHLVPLVLGSRQYSAKLQTFRQLAAQLHPAALNHTTAASIDDAATAGNDAACCHVAIGTGRVLVTDPAALPAAIKAASASGEMGLSSTTSDGSSSEVLGAATDEEWTAERIFAFDHVYNRQHVRAPDAVLAVLYGSPGSACFAALHAALTKAADEGAVVYVWRPLLLPQCEAASGCARVGTGGALSLPGWGVEAALKNTEYSAMDDKTAATAAAAAGAGAAGGAGGDSSQEDLSKEVRGFKFDVLVSRKPHLRQELLTFRDALASAEGDEQQGGGEGDSVKVWAIKDVGLQAVQRVSSASEPLGLLTDIAQSFPSLVSSLSKHKVDASLRSAVTSNQQYLSPGANFLLINGIAFDINTLDYFGLLERLRSEARLADRLRSAGLSGALVGRVMRLRAEDSSGALEELRLDLGGSSSVSKAGVVFLNDLERDKQYARFGSSLMELLNTMPGRFRPLARNVFTLIVVADPTSRSGAGLARMALSQQQQGYPIRYGAALVVPSLLARLEQARRYPFQKQDTPAFKEMALDEQFARAFLMINDALGPTAAWRLWRLFGDAFEEAAEASDASGSDELIVPTLDMLEDAFAEAWTSGVKAMTAGTTTGGKKAAARKSAADAWAMLEKGTGYAAEVGLPLQSLSKWLVAKGLAKTPTLPKDDSDTTSGSGKESAVEAVVSRVWLNGQIIPVEEYVEQGTEQEILYKVMYEMQKLQELLYYGKLNDDGSDALSLIMGALEGTVSRYNPDILGAGADNGAGQKQSDDSASSKPRLVSLAQLAAHHAAKSLTLLWRDGSGALPRLHGCSQYVVADLGSDGGRELVAQAARFMSEIGASRDCRLTLVLNPQQQQAGKLALPSLLEVSVALILDQAAAAPGNRVKASNALHKLMSDSALVARLAGDILKGSATEARVVSRYLDQTGLDGSAFMSSLVALVDLGLKSGSKFETEIAPLNYRAQHAQVAREVFGLAPGASAVVSSGKVLLVHDPAAEASGAGQALLAEDLQLLALVATQHQGGAAVANLVKKAHAAGELPEAPKGVVATAASDPPTPPALQVWLDSVVEVAAAELAAAVAAQAEAQAAAQQGGGAGHALPASASKQLQQVLGMLAGKAVQVGSNTGSTGSSTNGSTDGTSAAAALHIEVILNPLTRAAQRVSQVLQMLRQVLSSAGAGVAADVEASRSATAAVAPVISLYLNPQKDLSDLPLKSYYRYALPEFPAAGAASGPPEAPSAFLARLPAKRVLTLNMDVPEAWLVEGASSNADLDNLRLADIPGKVAYAEYELDALMLTGSCIDVGGKGRRATPPRGLQLRLGPRPSSPQAVDTLVMANLAYWQLKAAPGRWLLGLAPGRSQQLYTILPQTGPWTGDAVSTATAAASSSQGGLNTEVAITSFSGAHLILRVAKRPGMEAEDVLRAEGEAAPPMADEDDDDDAMADDEDDEYADPEDKAKTLSSSSSAVAASSNGELDVVNVFTVASGHMYERLQRIMMLSVVNNTRARVKFWIIKNYLSPQHRLVLPELAAKYGFDYEFVTYKWPHWLNKQTDKQRLIWAYKILFLDVLFPLGVPRIIFVDSDQVVRGDLAELYRMDIKGAPYAYTPFCDNARDMDEYRFWKGGFWKEHLRGKPYHISALYLVDLKRFRQIAAGDQLRVVYEQLSKDPNSLANLDQDLPNYAQHSIKIHSLPQEWLWCESWCGNATKDKAKTIDLCNNPRTKEPKLNAARRIIPEWNDYDAAQQAVADAVLAAHGMLPAAVETPTPAASASTPQQQQQAGSSSSDHSEL